MDNRAIWRGKRIDNGEWVEGFLMMPVNRPHEELSIQSIEPDKHGIRGFAEVDPSTLGQCTGLRDKNGVWIYDSDIVNCYRLKYEVVWQNNDCRFIGISPLSWNIKEDKYTLGNGNTLCYLSDCRKFEIIGNIHDNPSLLKGVKQK